MRMANEFVAFLLRHRSLKHTQVMIYGHTADPEFYVDVSIFWPEICNREFRRQVTLILNALGYDEIVDKSVIRTAYKWFYFNKPDSLDDWTMVFKKGNE